MRSPSTGRGLFGCAAGRPPRASVGAATFAFLVVAALCSGCAKQPVFLPSHDLDRPTDVAFSCVAIQSVAGSDTKIVGAQPMDACHPPGTKDPLFDQIDATGTQYKTFAFLPNSERGDLSVIDMSYCRSNDDACRQHALQPGAALVDLDPNTIGYGGVPVGELPEVIAASQDGCRLVTGNRGSCDLTLLDPAALLSPRLTGQPLGTYGKTFMVRTGSGQPLAVAPGEITFVPQQTNVAGEGRGPAQLCDATGTLAAPVGMPPATPQARASWHAVVTFPSCDLVALVDLQTETILDSYRVRPGRNTKGDSTDVTFFHTGAEPVCPRIDCGPGAGTTVDAGTVVTQPVTDDAGAGGAAGSAGAGGAAGEADVAGAGGAGGEAAGGSTGSSTGGAAVVTLDDAAQGLQVKPLAIRPEGTRLYFGATNWSAVGALDIAGATLSVPAIGAITPLYDTKGITRLRLSVDPYAYVNGHLPKVADAPDPNDPTRPELGRFVARTDGANLQYLYAIARDASLRVLDVSRPDPKECDLGIDPSAVPESDPRRKCFPFGASDNPPRLPQAIYRPGLRFPSAPQDVAFAYYWTQPSTLPSDQALNEQILNGAFGFVLTGGGGLFILNVDPEPRLIAKVYYVATDPDSTQHVLDVEPANATGLTPVGGLRVESPLPLPNSQRDPNVITYSQSLQPTVGPARPDPSTLFTSNGPLLRSFLATTTRENATIVPLLSNGTWTAPPASSSIPTYVFFPNPVMVVPQTWTIIWEPDITGTRNAGDIDRSRGPKADPSGLAFALSDRGASFCYNGIFPGDVVTLTGCTTDGNCGPGRVCVHSEEAPASASGYPINGLCIKRSSSGDKDVKRRCGPLLRSFRRYEIQATNPGFDDAFKDQSTPQSTVVLLPKKAELPVVGQCGAMCPPRDRQGVGIANFACEPDGVNQGRCLLRCDGEGGEPDDNKCAIRTGSVCVDFRATDGHSYCSDGAPLSDGAGVLDDACGLDQLVQYSVAAGKSFVVAGSAVGRADPGIVAEVREPSAGAAGGAGGAGDAGGAGGSAGAPATPGTGYYQCAPDRSSPGVVARIPLDLPRCASPKLTPSSFKQAMTAAGETPHQEPTDAALKAIFTDSTVPAPNPCLIEYGPSTSSQDANGAGGATAGAGGAGGAAGALAAGPTYSALFQNREVRFVLTNLETTTGDTVQLRLGVNGGSLGQQISVAVDSAIGLPARVVVGPVPAADQTVDPPVPLPAEAGYLPSDLPYLFVIDQRSSAGGRLASRGQILRIAPRIADTAPVPGYQSGQTSNSYFPIQ